MCSLHKLSPVCFENNKTPLWGYLFKINLNQVSHQAGLAALLYKLFESNEPITASS